MQLGGSEFCKWPFIAKVSLSHAQQKKRDTDSKSLQKARTAHNQLPVECLPVIPGYGLSDIVSAINVGG